MHRLINKYIEKDTDRLTNKYLLTDWDMFTDRE